MVEVPRDRYGKPLITPPDGGKPVPYMRASSFGDVLDDKTQLELWKMRLVAKGVATNTELRLAAATTPLEEKGRLNQIARDAVDAMGGGKKASIGTSLHAVTEALDRGDPVEDLPFEYEPDIVAYQAATSPFRHIAIEEFMVCDELQVAGTPDRLSLAPGFSLPVVTDLKTGGNGNYLGKHCVQLAIYAHSQFYNPESGQRTPIEVEQGVGYVFHMPSGQGTCDVYELDLEAGWEGALLAADVRRWRKRRGLAVPATFDIDLGAAA